MNSVGRRVSGRIAVFQSMLSPSPVRQDNKVEALGPADFLRIDMAKFEILSYYVHMHVAHDSSEHPIHPRLLSAPLLKVFNFWWFNTENPFVGKSESANIPGQNAPKHPPPPLQKLQPPPAAPLGPLGPRGIVLLPVPTAAALRD